VIGRKGRDDGEKGEEVGGLIGYAMGDSGRGKDQHARPTDLGLLAHGEVTFACQDEVELVLVGVVMQGLGLAGLQAVEAGEEASGMEEGVFEGLGVPALGVIQGADEVACRHGMRTPVS